MNQIFYPFINRCETNRSQLNPSPTHISIYIATLVLAINVCVEKRQLQLSEFGLSFKVVCHRDLDDYDSPKMRKDPNFGINI